MKPSEIKEARKQLGLTQTEAARLLGYGSRTRVSEIESGSSRPSASVIRLLRAYLDGYRPQDWNSKTPEK